MRYLDQSSSQFLSSLPIYSFILLQTSTTSSSGSFICRHARQGNLPSINIKHHISSIRPTNPSAFLSASQNSTVRPSLLRTHADQQNGPKGSRHDPSRQNGPLPEAELENRAAAVIYVKHVYEKSTISPFFSFYVVEHERIIVRHSPVCSTLEVLGV